MLDFIRDIYAQGGDRNSIKLMSQTFLKATLSDYPEMFKLKDLLINKIRNKFRLLGPAEIDVMDDFMKVFDILNLERTHN